MEADTVRTLEQRIDRLERELARSHARERRRRRGRLLALGALIFVPLTAWAVNLDVPYVFTNGTIADAEEVNANFAAVESAVDAVREFGGYYLTRDDASTIPNPVTTTTSCPGGFTSTPFRVLSDYGPNTSLVGAWLHVCLPSGS